MVAKHVAQHEVLAILRVGHSRRAVRIEVRRRIRNAGEHGRLGDVEVLGRLGEIGLRRGLRAVGLVPIEDLVEVERQDVVLGKAALDLERQHGLAHLTLQRGIVAHE